jgi:beta-glucanase (GH16 family)
MTAAPIRYCLLLLLCLQCQMVYGGWVDPDTKEQNKKLRSNTDKEEYELVMSDEFNRDGRHFKDGYDPAWTGIEHSDDDQTAQGRRSLHYYNSSSQYLITRNGSLVITTTTEDTKWRGWNPYKKKYDTMERHFRSGMVQSWNKFCFTGGILEVSVKLPGRHDIGGLWPAVWLLGNLGRATFEQSTNLMWPWSYEECNRELQHAQEISGCDVTSHYNLQPGKGRGAIEIDIIEAMAGPNTTLPVVQHHVTRPYCSMTLQVKKLLFRCFLETQTVISPF